MVSAGHSFSLGILNDEACPVYSLEQMVEILEPELEGQKPDYHDFVECFMFSREEAVMMTGNMVETAHTDKLNETGLWHKS